jgi:hypothetical protein
MANVTPPPQNPPNPFDEINGKLDTLATRVGVLETAVGEVKTGIGDLKTTAGDVRAAVDNLKTLVDNAKAAADSAKTAADNTKKGSVWPVLAGAGIAAAASIIVSLIASNATLTAAQKNFEAALGVAQKNFEATLAAAKTNLDNAAKNAFEAGRGASALQDYDTGRGLIGKIETEFRESAVQGSVKKELGGDLRGFKLLADRLKVPALTELSDYAGQLLWAYSRGDKHWADYEKQERQNLEQRGEKALQALEDWAKNQ